MHAAQRDSKMRILQADASGAPGSSLSMPGMKPGATPPIVGKAVCVRNDRIVSRTSARDPIMPTNAMKSPRSGKMRPNGVG